MCKQFFHRYIGNRTKSAVFEGDVGAFEQHVLIGVGETPAVGRPDVVDAASIVVAEEGAGAALDHVVAFVVEPQVLGDEGALAHAEAFADAFDVGALEAGGVVLAAGGAAQAVDLRHRRCVCCGLSREESPLVGLLQQLFIGFLLGAGAEGPGVGQLVVHRVLWGENRTGG